MNGIAAVLGRELRAQVRRATVHRTRFACALVALAALAALLTVVTVTVWTPAGPVQTRLRGAEVFAWLGRLTALLAIGAVPLLTADTLSRERREGTLPLLFLTPLRPAAVVFGKAVHALVQAGLVFLSVIPVLAVPLLLGGVSALHLVATLVVLAAVMLLGLAAGILASSRCERSGRALALAYLLTLAGVLAGQLLLLAVGWGGAAAAQWLNSPGLWLARAGELWDLATLAPAPPGLGGGVPLRRRLAAGFGAPASLQAQAFLLAAAAWLGVVLALAARTVRRLARSEPESPAAAARRRAWTEARLFRGWFHRMQRRNLDRNPLVWLQRRTPVQSLHRWAWLGVTGLVWTNVITGIGWISWDSRLVVLAVPLLLGIGLVFQSAGILRAEREAGSIELLLVTGLGESQLIRGVLRAATGTFLPAVALHAGVHYALQGFWRLGEFPTLLLPLGTATLAFPLIGLDHALRDGRTGRGLARVAALGLLLPAAVAWAVATAGPALLGPGNEEAFPLSPSAVAAGVHGVLALLAWRSARRSLVDRTFLMPADAG